MATDPLEELQWRCREAGLQAEIKQYEGKLPHGRQTNRRYLAVATGRSSLAERKFKSGFAIFADHESLPAILASSFEQFRPLAAYRAIWSASRGVVECEVSTGKNTPLQTYLGIVRVLEAADEDELWQSEYIDDTQEEIEEVLITERATLFEAGETTVSIGWASTNFKTHFVTESWSELQEHLWTDLRDHAR